MICKDNLIIFENSCARIEISSIDSRVLSVIDKGTDEELKGTDSYFFSLVGLDKERVLVPQKLTADGNIISVKTEIGEFEVCVSEEEDFFSFELFSSLPKGVYKLIFANIKFDYDFENKENCGAVCIPLTYWVNPCFFPDAKSTETKGEVLAHLKDKGAKLALVVAPICEHREIIKKATETVDKRYGIKTCHGGAWSTESELNYGNSTIILDSSPEGLRENMEFFKSLGVDQLDIHKGKDTFLQGDFSYNYYRDDAHFKAEVSDYLEKNGMVAGLHTYSFYIDYDCDAMLSNPECQKDFGVLETFTLAGDIDKNCVFVKTIESTADVCDHYGFFTRNTPYILIGREMIEFENAPDGFKVKKRGACGTTAVAHKRGEKIKHVDGYYHGVAPIPGSELFFEIARNTAKTFDMGGFRTIYLDALDGIYMHCHRDEAWFYMAAFVCELIANCKREPMIEASTLCPALWPSRGRFGAFDTAARGYKEWNKLHSEENKAHADRYATATLGWYNLYPVLDKYPGNLHTKYHHIDQIHHLGTLAIADNSCIVFSDPRKEDFEKIPALRRNRDIYRNYDELRKKRYFTEDVLEKIRKGEYEYHVDKTDSEEYVFVEKEYQTKKIYDFKNEDLNCGAFKNPFKQQTPFVRIEALLSAKYEDAEVLLEMDEEKTIAEQSVSKKFENEFDCSKKIAKTVSVRGNGKTGSAICIAMLCGTNWGKSYYKFFIDTDFEGIREFVLIESDNGERPDLPFDDIVMKKGGSVSDDEDRLDLFEHGAVSSVSSTAGYAVYRTDFNHDRVTEIMVKATKAAKDVRISSIKAVPHVFAALKNPSIQIGDSVLTFNCELKSTDFIEFDGTCAKIIDRYGNEKKIEYSGNLVAPGGGFDARLDAENCGDGAVMRANLTLGFTGGIVK